MECTLRESHIGDVCDDILYSEIRGWAQGIQKLIRQLNLFNIGSIVLPTDIHDEKLTCIRILSHIELFTEQVWVLYFNQRLNMSIPKVHQIDWVFIACDHVW